MRQRAVASTCPTSPYCLTPPPTSALHLPLSWLCGWEGFPAAGGGGGGREEQLASPKLDKTGKRHHIFHFSAGRTFVACWQLVPDLWFETDGQTCHLPSPLRLPYPLPCMDWDGPCVGPAARISCICHVSIPIFSSLSIHQSCLSLLSFCPGVFTHVSCTCFVLSLSLLHAARAYHTPSPSFPLCTPFL